MNSSPEFESTVDALVGDVVMSVDSDMRGQPASMVYEILDTILRRRLPGVAFDEGRLRDAAARISVGVLAGWPDVAMPRDAGHQGQSAPTGFICT